MQKAESAGWQGPSLGLILGLIAVIVVAGGVFAFWRYVDSERWVRESLVELEAKGKTLDIEGCIDATLAWHHDCEANKTLCDNAIPLGMYHCLEQRDRHESCLTIDRDMVTGGWLMERCRERGTPCKVMKKCPCAATYRALDSFCRADQKAVQIEL
ncbi:MAG: hypothetical protein H6710_12875 [Myxococcales bacterium]|nr:hypothetical protein [Myxococcales bacterium]MCB9705307.1 hypothetical protein [Myxococcales bacterium]